MEGTWEGVLVVSKQVILIMFLQYINEYNMTIFFIYVVIIIMIFQESSQK